MQNLFIKYKNSIYILLKLNTFKNKNKNNKNKNNKNHKWI